MHHDQSELQQSNAAMRQLTLADMVVASSETRRTVEWIITQQESAPTNLHEVVHDNLLRRVDALIRGGADYRKYEALVWPRTFR